MFHKEYGIEGSETVIESPTPTVHMNFPGIPTGVILDVLPESIIGSGAQDTTVDVVLTLNLVTDWGTVAFNAENSYEMVADDIISLLTICSLASPNKTVKYS